MKKLLSILFITAFMIVLSSNVYSVEKRKYGEVWQYLDDISKISYIRGFSDGLGVGILKTTEEFFSKDKMLEKYYIIKNKYEIMNKNSHDNVDIKNNMDYLYNDPANVYLPFSLIYEFSIKRLEGKDIYNELIEKRRTVLYLYDTLQ